MATTREATRRKSGRAAHASDLLVERRKGVLLLTLARPDRRNSLSEAMLHALQAAIADAGADPAVRAVVLAAAGPVFCAGHDLKELTAHRTDADRGRAFTEKLMHLCSTVMQAILKGPKPVIAAVQGTASAAGCQLVATCDLAVASEEALFCTPGVNIGLFCSTPMVALTRNVSRKRAMEMLLLGEMLPAREAAEYGLVNRVVAADKVLDEALALAALIASKPPVTIATGKEAFYRQIEMPLAEAYDYAASVMVENMLHTESEEGIGAFLEKRPADWDKS
jgi:enoyl-CoA hydratase/carnithine racemase